MATATVKAKAIRTRTPINGAKLREDIKEFGITEVALSKILKRGNTYISEQINDNRMVEENLKILCELIGHRPIEYIVVPEPEPVVAQEVVTKTVAPEIDMTLIVSTIAETREEIRQTNNMLMNLHKMLFAALTAINDDTGKIVQYTSQCNAKMKSLDTDITQICRDINSMATTGSIARTAPDTKATLDALKDIGANVSSLKANAQRHYETQKTQLDKMTVEVKRKKET